MPKTKLIFKIERLDFENLYSNHGNAKKGLGYGPSLGTHSSYYKLIIFIFPQFPINMCFSL